MAKSKCNHICFECTYYDCIEDSSIITPEERKEIRDRDDRYFNNVKHLQQKPTRSRRRKGL